MNKNCYNRTEEIHVLANEDDRCERASVKKVQGSE